MVVRFSKRFQKDLKSAPKQIQNKVFETILKLEASENLEAASLNIRKMEGQKPGENFYRIRLGDWRLGVEYVAPDITLLRILHRGSIYKSFPPS